MGPYTAEEHMKRGLVVCEPCLNRVYKDSEVRLLERLDPDEGKKKRVCALEECDVTGPIPTVPLRFVQ